MNATLRQLTERAELLMQPEPGSLHVPSLDITIRWDSDGCVAVANDKEHIIDELSGVSLQISTWQSPPEISWFRPDKPGGHWLGVEFYLSGPAGVGKRVRLKARISEEEAAELPLMELGHAREVDLGQLTNAIAAMRYHGADLSRGVEGLILDEPPPSGVAAPWWQPVDLTLLSFCGVFGGLLAGAGQLFPDVFPLVPVVAFASLSGAALVFGVVIHRWIRKLHSSFSIPVENTSYAALAIPGLFAGLFLLFSWGQDTVLDLDSMLVFLFLVLLMTACCAFVLRRQAAKFRVQPEVPTRSGKTPVAQMLVNLMAALIFAAMLVQVAFSDDWRVSAAVLTLLLLICWYLAAVRVASRNWPDWYGPRGSLDLWLHQAQQKGKQSQDKSGTAASLTFHGVLIIRATIILAPSLILLAVLSPEPGPEVIVLGLTLGFGLWGFERWVIQVLKTDRWDAVFTLSGGRKR